MGQNEIIVSVTIVTHNSESSLRRCLESVLAQDAAGVEVIVIDNGSRDQSRSILADYQDRLHTVYNAENRGFAAAQNQAIRLAQGNWVLVLNPDVWLAPDFLSRLLRAGELDSSAGTICGKLLRALPGLRIPEERRLDSAGIYFTPTFRHFDRGLHEPDGEEYEQPAYVFGATGAAALFRRTMIEDTSVNGEFFDEDFFFYREDADIAWRAQLLGWRCLYIPDAVGYHVRRVFPGNRRLLPEEINRHSVKNRFLMRIKNAGLEIYWRNLVPVTVRDAAIVVYCLFRERSSLAAFSAIGRCWRRTLAKRRIIQQRRRVPDSYIQSWFRFRPVTVSAEPSAGSRGSLSSPQKADRPVLPLPAASSKPSRLPQLWP